MVYKLDFNPQSAVEKDSYVQLYADYGWEYLQDLNEYSYFRKSVSNTDDHDMDIFSDNQSKLEMLKRIFLKKLVPVLAIFLLCVVFPVMSMVGGGGNSAWNRGFLVFWAILFLVYLAIFIHCGIGFYRLKKNYSHRVW